MGTFEEYLRRKRLQEQNGIASNEYSGMSFRDYTIAKLGEDALYENAKKVASREVVTQVETKKKKKEKDTWFKSGAFGDGKGNILTDTALTYWSSVGDAYVGAAKGIVGLVEGVADLGMYGVGAAADLVGADGVAKTVRGAAKKNTTDAIYSPAEKLVDKYSVFGNKSDNVSKGVGQALGIIATAGAGAAAGLTSTGATILTTGANFLSSAGSGMSEAYAGGANDKEAAIYGGIKGGIDAGTELLFGGLGKVANATGISKGIGGFDDMAADLLTKKITNQLAKNTAKYALKSAGEGVEEVIAGALTAKAKQIYSEEEYSTLLEDENLLEQFIVGSLVGGIVSTPSLVQSNASGRDYTSGLTVNEQKVVDAEVKNRIEAQETDGKKLNKREQAKILEEVQNDLKRGGISTDVIESTLVGESETYKNYKSVTAQEKALVQKIKDINNDTTLTVTQKDGLIKAFKNEIEALNKKKVEGEFVTELDALTEKDTYLRESYNELGRSKQKFTADLSKYDDKEKEVIQAAMDSEVVGNSNQTHEFVDKLAKIYSEKGIFFKLTNTEKIRAEGRDVEGATVNGYVTEDGVVVLNVDSMKSLNTIVGHEITHTFEKNGVQDPELQNFVIELSKIRGDYNTKWQQIQNSYSDERLQKMYGKDADFETIRRAELTADLIGDYLFTDRKFIEELSVQKPNIFKRIYEEIKYLVKTFTGSKEARQLEQVKRQFDKLYKQTSNTSENVKYKLEDIANMSEKSYNHHGWAKVNDILNDTELADFQSKVGEKNKNGKWYLELGNGRYMFAVGENGVNSTLIISDGDFNAPSIEKVYHIGLDSETDIEAVRDVIYESEKDSEWTLSSVAIEEIYGNEIVRSYTRKDFKTFQQQSRKYEGTKSKVDIRFDSELQDGSGSNTEAKTSVNDEVSSTDDAFFDAQNDTVKYSISEDNKGRKLTKEQQEYFKDSKVVDENGNLKVMYHGTANDFTVFNPMLQGGKNGTAEGYGIYFADTSEVSDAYGGKLMEGYLNITHPATSYEKTIKKSDLVKLIKATSEAEAQQLVNDGDYDNIEDALKDTWVSNYVYTYGMSMKQAYNEVANSILSMNENDMDIVQEVMTGVAIRNYEAAYEFYNILKTTTGIDGFITEWENNNIKGWKAQIALAFDSNQFKNIDNTKPTSNPDIRYSLSENTGTLDDDIDAMWDAFTTEDWDEILGTSWITKLGYNVVEEETTVKATEEMQNEEEDKPRYKGDTSTVGKKAKLTDERIERLFSAYGADNPKYAKAYVTSIHPRDFLSLTLSDSSFEKWDDAANRGDDKELFPLDIDKLKKETQTPYLIVDTSTGRVTGHEGRHRMRALLEAGVTEVPIAIEDIRTKYSKEKEASMFISSQEYSKGYVNNNFGTEIKNLIPLNKIYREEILASYGGKGDINFSLSNQNENIAPVGSYNVYGRDIALKTTEPAVVEDIAPVREVAELPTPLTEEMANERDAEQQNIDTLVEAPEEIEAPYYSKDEDIKLEDPFDERDIKDVGKRNVKAYMYENPEVKPYFQQEAQAMLWELQNSVKGEKNFNSQLYYDTNGELGWFGTTRETSDDIAYLLDNFKYTYADIEKGLKAIIEDHGAENNAISKRIEFALNDRLKDGYTDFMSGEDVPANQDYINLLMDKQINTYSDEAYYEWLQSLATEEAPPLAPLEPSTDARDVIAPTMEDISSLEGSQRVMDFENNQIVDEFESDTKEQENKIYHKSRKELKQALIKDRENFLIDAMDEAKNIPSLLLNNTDTIRATELVFGRENAKLINKEIFQKAIDNEAKSIAWQNKERADIKKLGIKPKSKESAAVQKYGEKQYENAEGKMVEYGDIELATEFPDTATQKKIKRAAQVMRNKYDSYIDEANAVLTELGFNPIQKRKDYMRHFEALTDAFSRMGIPFNIQQMKEYDLPTDINGLTDTFVPQKNFFANIMERKGNKTTLDAVTGIDGYIGGISNLIHHTEDIQRGRAFEDLIRDNYGRKEADKVLSGIVDETAKQKRKQQIADNHLSGYASWVHDWTDNLAGKKDIADRGAERRVGRRVFDVLDTIRKQVGANMIGFNVSSSLTNLIAPVQALAKTDKVAFTKGTIDTFRNIFKKDSFMDNNSFLTSRMGTDKLSKTLWEKTQDAGFIFMKGMDYFTSNLIVRSKYNELISKGVSEEVAHKEAGQFAARIMGDRTKGANPQLYNSKLFNMVAQFQLEVNNQLYSMFYDTYHESKEKAEGNALRTASGMTFTLGQLFIATHIFGQAFESVAGYNPTFDLIDIIKTALGLGDEEEEEKPLDERLEEASLKLLKALPYSSLFVDGGRIPMGNALPISQFIKGVDEYGNEKSRTETLAEALPYYLAPAGYGQVKKSVAGLNMFDDSLPVAGSYTDSGNLRFPVEDTASNRLQAAIFGQWANENARDYFDNERQPLKEKQIQEFADLDIPIQEYWEYREGLKEQDTIEEKFDYIAGLDLPVSKKNILINNVVDREEEVNLINYDDFSGYEEFDFATKNPEKYEFFKSNNISYADYSASEESKEAYSWAYNNPEKYVVSKTIGDVVQYKKYTSELNKIAGDKDENGKSISGSRKTKVANYINSLNVDYGAKIILYKSEYPSDDTYNMEIVEYLNNRSDITYAEMVTILAELGFTVEADGTVRWN